MNLINYIKYRTKWHLAPHFNFKSPVHIDIELNNTCNQQCTFCWHSQDGKPFEPAIMQSSIVTNNIVYAYKNAYSVKFNWRGEPLISVDRLAFYSFVAKDNGLYTMINTNGKNLKDSIIKLDNIAEIIISVDSLDPVNYLKLHNDEIGFMLDLLRSLKVWEKSGALKNKIKLNFHDNEINHFELKNNIVKYMMYLPFKIIHRFTENREGSHISLAKERKRKKMCPHMKRRLTVAANGKIFPCCVAYDEPDDLCLGTDINQAWDSEKRRNLIKNYKRGIYTETCKNCTSGDIYREYKF